MCIRDRYSATNVLIFILLLLLLLLLLQLEQTSTISASCNQLTLNKCLFREYNIKLEKHAISTNCLPFEKVNAKIALHY